uniref:Peptidoglycan glycosyltransferase n=1 Tax=uncultured Alphaproteobacteria bacterium TaxID=91750 RepID=A0A6M4NMN9_9PROT|nr:peptidoglycan glycosyltransferase [uncultured Alphaproteobacteria bacterium]
MNRDNSKGKVLIFRTLVWGGIQFVLLMGIVARLYFLQVYEADKYKTMSDENRISSRILVPPRGVIFDRNGVPIANNKQNFQAMIVAEQASNVKETIEKFKKLMPLSEKEEARVFRDLKRYRRFVPIKLKEGLSWEDVSRILLAAPEMPGIIVDDGLSRDYPFGQQMAHVLGYVAAVSEKDLKTDNDPLLETPGFKIGRIGLEKKYEHELRGKGGNLKLEVNAVGRIMKEIEREDGVRGEKLELTIDSRLQQKAYELFGEESGAAVLMDVHTGEILTFISMPSYDSNDFVQGVSQELYDTLLYNEKQPLINKAIAGRYSPGSTFKMIVALAALESGTITKDAKVSCYGKMNFGNHLFHCWKKGGHGALNVVEALQHSCDIFFYEVAQKVGIERIAAMARRFGLGAPTALNFDDEKAGIIPDKAWKLANLKSPWQGGETLIAGIGQGYILTTPMQLAVMTARIANGGIMVEPSLTPVSKEKIKKYKNIGINPAYMALVKEGMCSVVNRQGGTALLARFDYNGQKMCGKTGTTQVKRISLQERQTGIIKQEDTPWKYRNHALFVGYAPQDNPRYAVAVLVEHGGGGSTVAAPIASALLKEALILEEEKK